MEFVGTGDKLEDIDLPELGDLIGVGEDEIHAVLDVECAGSGFDAVSRPRMLFEPHVFYKQLRKMPDLQKRAVREGLAYKSWKPGNYPRDSYPRLNKAIAIHKEAALRSCSWGLGQTMGFNASLCGFDSVVDMVEAYKLGEREQLEGMINFIVNTGLDDELRNHDWSGFARGYNGPKHYVHNYAGRLERAFDKWAAIEDTEWKRAQAVETTAAEPVPALNIPVDAFDRKNEVDTSSGKKITKKGFGIAAAIAAVTAALATLREELCSIPFIDVIIKSCGG